MFSAINEEHKLIENEFDYRTFEETEKNERVAKGNENKKKKRSRKPTGDLGSGKVNSALAAWSRLRHRYFQLFRATGVGHMTIVALA